MNPFTPLSEAEYWKAKYQEARDRNTELLLEISRLNQAYTKLQSRHGSVLNAKGYRLKKTRRTKK